MYNLTSKNKVLFVIFDILAIVLSYKTLGFFVHTNYTFFHSNYFVLFLVIFTFITNIFTEEYRYIEVRGYLKELRYSIIYAIQVVIVFSFIMLLYKEHYLKDLIAITRLLLLGLFLITIIYVYSFRIIVKFLTKQIKEEEKNALILTNFKEINKLEENLKKNNYNIAAYISFSVGNLEYNGKAILNSIEDIREYLSYNRVDEIFVASKSYKEYASILKQLRIIGIPTSIDVSEYSKQYIGDTVIKNIDKSLFITSAIKIATLRQVIIKRSIDIIGGLVGTLLMIIIAIIIYPKVQKESKGPLIFKQKRVGQNGKVFNIYKFRSMYLNAEQRKKELMEHNDLSTTLMFKMKNDPRIFPFGQKLRDWSLDELPQFINVLKGDMSLVGTRPPTIDEYKNYELHHFKRLATKPGITGLWQVSGRSDIEDFEEVVALDLKYIQSWSIGQDIKIILKTIKVVLKKEGSR